MSSKIITLNEGNAASSVSKIDRSFPKGGKISYSMQETLANKEGHEQARLVPFSWSEPTFKCRCHRLHSLRLRQDEEAQREGSDEALYLERILETAADGAVSLLQELPREHLGSLRLMLNQPIPSRARLDIWRLLLKHTAVKRGIT